METFLYVVASVVVSFLAIAAAIRSTSQHREARNKAGGLIIGGGAFWVLMSGLEVSSGDLSTKILFSRFHFVGVFLVTTAWLVLALLVSGHERLVNRKSIAALSVVPLVTLVLAFTNQSQNFFGISFTLNAVSPFYPLSLTEGLGFWFLDTGYSYALMLTGMVIILRRIGAARRLYRLQTFPMVILASIPLILNAIYHYNTSWFMYIDPTPVTLTVAAMILVWRLIYLSRLDVIPVAHEIVIDNLLESLIILDAGNRIVDLNPRAQDLIGHTMAEAVGKPIENMWIHWDVLRKALTTGAETEKEVTIYRENDRHVYELHCSNIEGATNLPYRLITLRDITERKLTEEKLREAERMAAIGETAAMVGHDLRNPLQAISSATYLLKKNLTSTILKQTEEMIGIIEESVRHSNRIVSDLLEYSREPKLKLEETDLDKLMKEAMASAVIPRNVEAKLAESQLRVMIDSEKIRRVFINIISNAIDAMPEGGQLAVDVQELKESVEISFTDTGPGISEEVMAKLWKPLNTSKAKGSGLGLAICRKLVKAHKGSISAKNVLGKGATFTITLPIKSRPELVEEEKVPQLFPQNGAGN